MAEGAAGLGTGDLVGTSPVLRHIEPPKPDEHAPAPSEAENFIERQHTRLRHVERRSITQAIAMSTGSDAAVAHLDTPASEPSWHTGMAPAPAADPYEAAQNLGTKLRHVVGPRRSSLSMMNGLRRTVLLATNIKPEGAQASRVSRRASRNSIADGARAAARFLGAGLRHVETEDEEAVAKAAEKEKRRAEAQAKREASRAARARDGRFQSPPPSVFTESSGGGASEAAERHEVEKSLEIAAAQAGDAAHTVEVPPSSRRHLGGTPRSAASQRGKSLWSRVPIGETAAGRLRPRRRTRLEAPVVEEPAAAAPAAAPTPLEKPRRKTAQELATEALGGIKPPGFDAGIAPPRSPKPGIASAALGTSNLEKKMMRETAGHTNVAQELAELEAELQRAKEEADAEANNETLVVEEEEEDEKAVVAAAKAASPPQRKALPVTASKRRKSQMRKSLVARLPLSLELLLLHA